MDESQQHSQQPRFRLYQAADGVVIDLPDVRHLVAQQRVVLVEERVPLPHSMVDRVVEDEAVYLLVGVQILLVAEKPVRVEQPD